MSGAFRSDLQDSQFHEIRPNRTQTTRKRSYSVYAGFAFTFRTLLTLPKTYERAPYIYANIDTGDGDLIGFNGGPESEAAYFSLNAMNNLVMDQEEFNNDPNEKLIAYTASGQSFELLHLDTPYAVYTTDVPTICSIAGAVLKCSNSGGSSKLLQLCPGRAVTDDLFIGNVVESGCVAPTLEVVPVCLLP